MVAAGTAYLGLAQAVVEAALRALPHFPADARHYAGATRMREKSRTIALACCRPCSRCCAES